MDWPLSPELAVSCGAGHQGARCTGLMAWLRTEMMSVTRFLGGRPTCCRGRLLCYVETGQDSSLGSSITGNLEGSGIKVPQWGSCHSHACPLHQVTDGATWAVLEGIVTEGHGPLSLKPQLNGWVRREAGCGGHRGVYPVGPCVWPHVRKGGRRSRVQAVTTV